MNIAVHHPLVPMQNTVTGLHPTTRVMFALSKLVTALYPNVKVPASELCAFVGEVHRQSTEDGYDANWTSNLVDTELEIGVRELVIGGPLCDKLDALVWKVVRA